MEDRRAEEPQAAAAGEERLGLGGGAWRPRPFALATVGGGAEALGPERVGSLAPGPAPLFADGDSERGAGEDNERGEGQRSRDRVQAQGREHRGQGRMGRLEARELVSADDGGLWDHGDHDARRRDGGDLDDDDLRRAQ